MKLTIALIGDHNENILAHKAIPLAIDLASNSLGILTEIQWISTDEIDPNTLGNFDAIWCVPGSPYKSMNGALSAIQFARENNIPFLGTCGGYQHAALEYARNVLGYRQADNSEVNPDTEMPLISALVCKLIEKKDAILLRPNSITAFLYQSNKVEEDYHCCFGVNPKYVPLYDGSNMRFTGNDEAGEPRVLEIVEHPYFIGTAFQPERSAFKGETHPLVVGFLKAAAARNA
ncbi:MAG: hypothetical protein M1480_08250 [Bacteroidetes bacterium]|nr:hypothetical protein [Bacteroidota bacterium]